METKKTFFDFDNLDNFMGDTEPEHWSKNFGKDVTERSVVSYLLRKKGFSVTQIASKMGCSYYSISHGINMIRRAKKVSEIMKTIGMTFDDVI